MACRVGITRDPARRKQEWGKKHTVRNWKILERGLTYKQAQEKETRLAKKLSCVSHPGGAKDNSRSWCVYRFEF